MTQEDKEFAQGFMTWSRIDSAAATQLLRWLQRNQDAGAHYCLTCADAIRQLHTRCCNVWTHWLETNPEKKRNGKKNTDG